MNATLLAVVAGYLAVVAALAVAAALGVRCTAGVQAGMVVAQILLVVQAAVAAATLLRGHRPADLPTHLGYLATSVALLPLLAPRPGGTGSPPWSRSSAMVAALACAVTAVVVVRLHVTWAGPA